MKNESLEKLVKLMEDLDPETTGAREMYADFSEDLLQMAITNVEDQLAEREALRVRLAEDVVLKRAVAVPSAVMPNAWFRFDAARTIVKQIDAAVEKAQNDGKPGANLVTVVAVADALIADGSTAADVLRDLEGNEHHDPRTNGWGWMVARVRDAVAAVRADAAQAARLERMAREDAEWEARGMVRCDRCGGAGGYHGWPGFTCFKCEGEKAVQKDS